LLIPEALNRYKSTLVEWNVPNLRKRLL